MATTSSTNSSQTPVDVLLDLALCGDGELWGLKTLLSISSQSPLYGRTTIDLFVGHLAKRLLQRALGYSVNLFKNATDLVRVLCDTKTTLSNTNAAYISADSLGNCPMQQLSACFEDKSSCSEFPPIYLCYVIEAVNRSIADVCSVNTTISTPAPLHHVDEQQTYTKQGGCQGGAGPFVSAERVRALCDLLQELIEFLVSAYCRMLSAQSPPSRKGTNICLNAYTYTHTYMRTQT